ncbi:MAG: hypothetical protein IKQ55_06605 [Kiritimatiellae bacterium]|nr:hypothetical protein [Kiritimatiellia bacterium]
MIRQDVAVPSVQSELLFLPMGNRARPENGVTIPAPRTTFACVPPGVPAGGTASMAGRAWNDERIGNANERIHAGLQLERPAETVAGKPLAALADEEAADPVLKLNTRKEPT